MAAPDGISSDRHHSHTKTKEGHMMITGLVRRPRLAGAFAAAAAGVLALTTISISASAATVGLGEVNGGVDFLNGTGGGVPISGCINGDAGNFNSTVLNGVIANTGPAAAFVGSMGANATFTSNTCESGTAGGGTVDTLTVSGSNAASSIGCTLNAAGGAYIRHGILVTVGLTIDCTIHTIVVAPGGVTGTGTVGVVALFIPNATSPCTSSTGATTCASHADFGGVFYSPNVLGLLPK
jgi:hypothetical protein